MCKVRLVCLMFLVCFMCVIDMRVSCACLVCFMCVLDMRVSCACLLCLVCFSVARVAGVCWGLASKGRVTPQHRGNGAMNQHKHASNIVTHLHEAGDVLERCKGNEDEERGWELDEQCCRHRPRVHDRRQLVCIPCQRCRYALCCVMIVERGQVVPSRAVGLDLHSAGHEHLVFGNGCGRSNQRVLSRFTNSTPTDSDAYSSSY